MVKIKRRENVNKAEAAMLIGIAVIAAASVAALFMPISVAASLSKFLIFASAALFSMIALTRTKFLYPKCAICGKAISGEKPAKLKSREGVVMRAHWRCIEEITTKRRKRAEAAKQEEEGDEDEWSW